MSSQARVTLPAVVNLVAHRPTTLPTLDLRLAYVLRYQDAKGETTARRIQPIEWKDDQTLVAYCFWRKDFRHFRVDRMEFLAARASLAGDAAEVAEARRQHWTYALPF